MNDAPRRARDGREAAMAVDLALSDLHEAMEAMRDALFEADVSNDRMNAVDAVCEAFTALVKQHDRGAVRHLCAAIVDITPKDL